MLFLSFYLSISSLIYFIYYLDIPVKSILGCLNLFFCSLGDANSGVISSFEEFYLATISLLLIVSSFWGGEALFLGLTPKGYLSFALVYYINLTGLASCTAVPNLLYLTWVTLNNKSKFNLLDYSSPLLISRSHLFHYLN